ncbi:MAG TPA: ImmA/IrrE family metallo-endopeptidase [Accumulibacter sp.]|jgi:Zn-dependent peptidase ImmA (M78 family)|nr:ImmA/IrrE family metallo-endopeptidase [Accumulibacter sp.]
MKLERIELADCGTPEALADAILRQAPDMILPVPVEEIAHQLDITEIRRIETKGFEGGLIAWDDKSDGVILVNNSGSRQRQRFTIGHELGHFLNPWHKPKNAEGFRCTSSDIHVTSAQPGDRATQMEVEANRFSVELLIPKPLFQKDLRGKRGLDVSHIVGLARKFDMSKESTARRYTELQDEACAVVISQNGKILRCYRHKEFPCVSVKPGDPVPAFSIAVSGRLLPGEPSEWNEIDLAIWSSRRKPGLLLEQVLVQRQGFRLILLALPEGDEDEEVEQDTFAVWDVPRFGR